MSLPPPSPAKTITFFAALQQLPDPRDKRGKRHDLAFVLCGVLLALMPGRARVSAIHRFLRNRFVWLRELTHAPVTRCLSRAHLPRLLARVDWAALNTLSLAHFGVEVESSAAGEWIAIDGKALRGSPGEHVVLARTQQSGDILVHQPLAGPKASEVPAVRTLLAQSPLQGRKVTLDAGHCNPTTIAQIHQAQGGYLVQLKANQPTLRAAVHTLAATAPRSAPRRVWTQPMAGSKSATLPSFPSLPFRSPRGGKPVACARSSEWSARPRSSRPPSARRRSPII
jgi:hypothetical protein